MSNRTDIVVETDNAEGQVLLSASRVYDLTEDKTQDTINSEVRNTLNHLEDGLAIIVNGDTCATAVPVGGYAYIKNNTHGLAEGLYTNTSASAFPTSGGTATSSVFTPVSGGGLNAINAMFNITDSYSGDVNNLETGFAYTSASASHAPSDSSYFIITIRAFTHASQIAVKRSEPAMYYRQCAGGTWGAWKLVSAS